MFKVENQCSNNVDNNRVNKNTVFDVENYFQIGVHLIFLISIECIVFRYFDSSFLVIIIKIIVFLPSYKIQQNHSNRRPTQNLSHIILFTFVDKTKL